METWSLYGGKSAAAPNSAYLRRGPRLRGALSHGLLAQGCRPSLRLGAPARRQARTPSRSLHLLPRLLPVHSPVHIHERQHFPEAGLFGGDVEQSGSQVDALLVKTRFPLGSDLLLPMSRIAFGVKNGEHYDACRFLDEEECIGEAAREGAVDDFMDNGKTLRLTRGSLDRRIQGEQKFSAKARHTTFVPGDGSGDFCFRRGTDENAASHGRLANCSRTNPQGLPSVGLR